MSKTMNDTRTTVAIDELLCLKNVPRSQCFSPQMNNQHPWQWCHLWIASKSAYPGYRPPHHLVRPQEIPPQQQRLSMLSPNFYFIYGHFWTIMDNYRHFLKELTKDSDHLIILYDLKRSRYDETEVVNAFSCMIEQIPRCRMCHGKMHG